MGEVWLALAPVDDGDAAGFRPQEDVCVVKTVRSDLRKDPEAVGRFLDEARVVQKLTHPRIARTIDAGLIDGTYFLCMEFISGRNVRDIISRGITRGTGGRITGEEAPQLPTLPETMRVHVLADVLEALAYAHSLVDSATGQPLHLVHRDLSPHNIMVGFDGRVKLIDFGLASHELKREMTRPGMMIGKLRYTAPEQIRDRAVDGRSDVFSAGVVLYELYAGERFYEGLADDVVWKAALKKNWRPRLWGSLPREIQHLLDVALRSDPGKRYANAAEFRGALLDAAKARRVDVRSMRKESAKVMRSLFESEIEAEREMILQASGLAEARTKLAMSKSELQGAFISLRAGSRTGIESLALRTDVLDLAQEQLAEVRRRASEPSPSKLPAGARSRERSRGRSRQRPRQGSLEASSEGLATGERAVFASSSDRTTMTRSDRKKAAADPDNTMALVPGSMPGSVPGSAPGSDNGAARFASAAVLASRATREQRHTDAGPLSDRIPTIANHSDTLASVEPPPRFLRTHSDKVRPLPPLDARTHPRRWSTQLQAGVATLAVLVVVLIATLTTALNRSEQVTIIAPPATGSRLLTPEPATPTSPAPAHDRAANDADDRADDDAADNAEAIQARAANAVKPEDPPTQAASKRNGTATTAGGDDHAPAQPDRGERRRPPLRRPTSDKVSPAKEPKTFKQQLDFLRESCVARLACAKSVLDSANEIAALTPEELKDLKDNLLPRCVERCRR